MLHVVLFSWPFHVGDASTIGANAKRQRGSQRSLHKLVATNSNSHVGIAPGPMRSNTTDGYYKPRQQVRCSSCFAFRMSPSFSMTRRLVDDVSYVPSWKCRLIGYNPQVARVPSVYENGRCRWLIMQLMQ